MTVDDAIALARPITHHDPSVHSVEVRGHNASIPFRYLYEAPDSYEGLMAVGDPRFTFFAAEGRRAIVYDPRQAELVYFTGLFPGIEGTIRNDELVFVYTFFTSEESDPSSGWQPGLHIDLPMILGSRDLTDPKLQSLQGGKYRLIFASKKYASLVATIDPSQSFEFTDIEIGDSHHGSFVEIHVNRTPPAVAPSIPSSGELRRSIAVKETLFNLAALPRTWSLLALTQTAMAPKPFGLREGVQSPARRQLESALGETVNWGMVDANLKRDIPKLQEALPLP